MSTPIKKEQIWLLTAVCLLLFTASSAGGLGIVWMRQQITKSAAQTVKLEMRLGEMERRSIYIKSKIAQLDNPTQLREKVKSKLIHPKRQQIVWLDTQRPVLGSTLVGDSIAPSPYTKVISYAKGSKDRRAGG